MPRSSTMFFSLLGLRELHKCGDLLKSRPIMNTRILIDAFVVCHFYLCFRVLRIKTKCNEKFKFLLSKKVYIYIFIFFVLSLSEKSSTGQFFEFFFFLWNLTFQDFRTSHLKTNSTENPLHFKGHFLKDLVTYMRISELGT